MRNPNGYGCIKKLSGQRRRPFAFYFYTLSFYPLSIYLSLAKAYIANASGWTIDIQPIIEPV